MDLKRKTVNSYPLSVTVKKRKVDGHGNSYPSSIPPLPISPSIIRSALLQHLDLINAIRTAHKADLTQRRLYVSGLGLETTTQSLLNTFSRYGEIKDGIVVTDNATGKSKGFGFVTFKHVDAVVSALNERYKNIDGRITLTQLASDAKNLDTGHQMLCKLATDNKNVVPGGPGIVQTGIPMVGDDRMGIKCMKVMASGLRIGKKVMPAAASLRICQIGMPLPTDSKKVMPAGPGIGQSGMIMATDNKKLLHMVGDDRMRIKRVRPIAVTKFGSYNEYHGGQGSVSLPQEVVYKNMGGHGRPWYGTQCMGYAGAGYGHVPAHYNGGHGAGLGHPTGGYMMLPTSAGMPSFGGYSNGWNCYGPRLFA